MEPQSGGRAYISLVPRPQPKIMYETLTFNENFNTVNKIDLHTVMLFNKLFQYTQVTVMSCDCHVTACCTACKNMFTC